MFSKLLLDIQRLYFDNKLFAYITMFSFNLINAFLLNELRCSVYFHFLRKTFIRNESCPQEDHTSTTEKKIYHKSCHKHIIIFNAMINYVCTRKRINFSPCDNKFLAWNLCLIKMYLHMQYGHQIIQLFWRRALSLFRKNVFFY